MDGFSFDSFFEKRMRPDGTVKTVASILRSKKKRTSSQKFFFLNLEFAIAVFATFDSINSFTLVHC